MIELSNLSKSEYCMFSLRWHVTNVGRGPHERYRAGERGDESAQSSFNTPTAGHFFPRPAVDYMSSHLNLPWLRPIGSIMINPKSHHFNGTIANYTTRPGIWLMPRVSLIIIEGWAVGASCMIGKSKWDIKCLFFSKCKNESGAAWTPVFGLFSVRFWFE